MASMKTSSPRSNS